jgi:3-isopropylmalate dehydrogenase
MGKDYPDVALDFMFVDNAAMKIIQNPSYFDVVVTENMFGDILTDEASVISGSLGLSPSASVGDNLSLFEPIHGSYPQVAGQNKANPVGAILSAAMLLNYSFGMTEEAKKIENAVAKSISEGYCTEDLKPEGAYTTSAVGDFIVEQIRAKELV